MKDSMRVILTEARQLIAEPEKWTQGAFARDRDGGAVDAEAEEARSFCAYGALLKASFNLAGKPHLTASDHASRRYAIDAIDALDVLIAGAGILLSEGEGEDDAVRDWNDADCRGHEEVLAAFDNALTA